MSSTDPLSPIPGAPGMLSIESPRNDIPQSQNAHELVFLIEDQNRLGFEAAFEPYRRLSNNGHGLAQREPVGDVRIVLQRNHQIPGGFLVRHGILRISLAFLHYHNVIPF